MPKCVPLSYFIVDSGRLAFLSYFLLKYCWFIVYIDVVMSPRFTPRAGSGFALTLWAYLGVNDEWFTVTLGKACVPKHIAFYPDCLTGPTPSQSLGVNCPL